MNLRNHLVDACGRLVNVESHARKSITSWNNLDCVESGHMAKGVLLARSVLVITVGLSSSFGDVRVHKMSLDALLELNIFE